MFSWGWLLLLFVCLYVWKPTFTCTRPRSHRAHVVWVCCVNIPIGYLCLSFLRGTPHAVWTKPKRKTVIDTFHIWDTDLYNCRIVNVCLAISPPRSAWNQNAVVVYVSKLQTNVSVVYVYVLSLQPVVPIFLSLPLADTHVVVLQSSARGREGEDGSQLHVRRATWC